MRRRMTPWVAVVVLGLLVSSAAATVVLAVEGMT